MGFAILCARKEEGLVTGYMQNRLPNLAVLIDTPRGRWTKSLRKSPAPSLLWRNQLKPQNIFFIFYTFSAFKSMDKDSTKLCVGI